MLRIIGGNTAEDEEWPWMAQIKFSNKLICGGALIAPYWVLTAAHCGIELKKQMKNMTGQGDDWSVVIGENSQFVLPKLGVFRISLAVLHTFTNYEDDIPRRDIALLRLNKKVEETSDARFICLPNPNFDDAQIENKIPLDPSPGKQCVVAGWGRTVREKDDFPEMLQFADLTIKSNAACQSHHTKDHNYLIDQTMFCAGTGLFESHLKDACLGDSGGPLFCDFGDGRYVVNGVVSFGYECASTATPGVYTKVSSYVDWIYRIMEEYDPEGDFNDMI